MRKLHELLAAENDVRNQYRQINEETTKVLGKPQLFQGKVVNLVMVKPGLDESTKKAMENAGSEVEIVGTTVSDRINYTGQFFTRLMNHRFQKDLTNQKAVADIIINGVNLAENVPATFLLELEKELTAYRNTVYAGIPTLDIKKDWIRDDSQPGEIFKTKEAGVRSKTEKDFQFKILDKATDKHQAQIEKWNVDVVVGTFETVEYAGMWTSKRKAEVLDRCDKLIVAVKEARARANQVEVATGFDIASSLLKYIEASEATPLKKS